MSEQISQAKLAAGRECLNLLDEYELGVQGAVWMYVRGLGEWRFYIVTSLVDVDGLVETYGRIERLFALKFNNEHLTIDDIHLGSPDEAIFSSMAQVIRVDGLIEMRNCVVGNVIVEHAYIYRLDRAPPVLKAKQARQKFDKKLKELERTGSG